MAPFPSYTPTWHTSTYPAISPLRPELSLTGKAVLLTGGGSGIGLAIAKSVSLASPSSIIILGRRPEVLLHAKSTIETLVDSKVNILAIPTDIASETSVTSAFSKISHELNGKPLDILISNAGYFTGPKPLGTETVEEWQTMFDVNLKGMYLVVRAFKDLAARNATIINISTAIAHLSPFPGFSSYAATKLAGSKLMEYVQAAYPEMRVVDLHPGQVTETDMAAKAKAKGVEKDDHLNALEVHIDDAELAGNFTVWLTSPEAHFLKGKFVWANWDADELKQDAEKIANSSLLTLGLEGASSLKY